MSEEEQPAVRIVTLESLDIVMLKFESQQRSVLGYLLGDSSNNEYMYLYWPMALTISTDYEGSTNIYSTKYAPFAEKDRVAVLKSSIQSLITPNEVLSEYYKAFVRTYTEDRYEQDLEYRLAEYTMNQLKEQTGEHTLDSEPPEDDDVIH